MTVESHRLKQMHVALEHYELCLTKYVKKLGKFSDVPVCKYCVKIAQVLVGAQKILDGDEPDVDW